jgi:hypothetical protein
MNLPEAIFKPSLYNQQHVNLPVQQTALFCRRHELQRTVYDQGVAAGYPTTYDFDELDK